jgi:hypothetical protein
MKKTVKVVIIGVLTLAVLFSAAIFYATQKIDNEKIRELVINNLDQALPGANIELGKIDYNLGFSIMFKVENLKLTLKQPNKMIPFSELFEVSSVEVKVPIWSILTGGGSIDFIMSKPNLTFYSKKEVINWNKALPQELNNEEKEISKLDQGDGKSQDLAGLAILSRIQANLKIDQLNLKYVIDEMQGDLLIEKIILKNLGISEKSALEIILGINKKIGNSDFATELAIIGEFDLTDFISGKAFSANVITTVSKTKTSLVPIAVPDVKIKSLLLMKDQQIDLNNEISIGDILNGKVTLKVGKTKEIATDLKLNVLLANAIESLPSAERQELLKLLDVKNERLIIDGNVLVNPSGLLTPQLKIHLSDAILVKALEGIPVSTNMNISLANKKVTLNVGNKMAGGNVDLIALNEIDINNFDINRLKPFEIKLLGNGVEFSREQLQKIIYTDDTKKKNAVAAEKAKTEQAGASTPPMLVPANISINLDKFKFGSTNFSSKGMIRLNSDVIKVDMQKRFNAGLISIETDQRILKSGQINGRSKINMNNFDLSSLLAFLPPMVKSIQGQIKFNGNADTSFSKEMTANFNSNFSVSNVIVDGPDIKKMIEEKLSKADKIKDKLQDLEIPNSIEKLDVVANGTLNLVKLQSFKFLGPPRSLDADGSGKIGLINSQKSDLTFRLWDKKGSLRNQLQQNFNIDHLPLRLVGNGLDIGVDYKYTLDLLTRGALKAQVGKQKEQVKEKAKEEVKEKAKEVFKGLLKKKR